MSGRARLAPPCLGLLLWISVGTACGGAARGLPDPASAVAERYLRAVWNSDLERARPCLAEPLREDLHWARSAPGPNPYQSRPAALLDKVRCGDLVRFRYRRIWRESGRRFPQREGELTLALCHAGSAENNVWRVVSDQVLRWTVDGRRLLPVHIDPPCAAKGYSYRTQELSVPLWVSSDGRLFLEHGEEIPVLALERVFVTETELPEWREPDGRSKKTLILMADRSTAWWRIREVIRIACAPPCHIYKVCFACRSGNPRWVPRAIFTFLPTYEKIHEVEGDSVPPIEVCLSGPLLNESEDERIYVRLGERTTLRPPPWPPPDVRTPSRNRDQERAAYRRTLREHIHSAWTRQGLSPDQRGAIRVPYSEDSIRLEEVIEVLDTFISVGLVDVLFRDLGCEEHLRTSGR